MSKTKTSKQKQKKPRKPLSEEGKPGRYDERNQLNDLTGKEWLLLTKSYWFSETSREDKEAYAHPAPFMLKDVERLISMFTKQGMCVLDPFSGSGTAILAANKMGRRAIGIDLNPNYIELAKERLGKRDYTNNLLILGDATCKLEELDEMIDYIVTSPPYHNILKNRSKGTRHRNGKNFRMGAREGIEYYSDNENDLGNQESYDEFISALQKIMMRAYLKLKKGKYCTIIISDFTVNKIETCVQSDIYSLMDNIGFEFSGTTVLLQDVKPLFPFGYPYAYKINHHHQNMMTFRKPK